MHIARVAAFSSLQTVSRKECGNQYRSWAFKKGCLKGSECRHFRHLFTEFRSSIPLLRRLESGRCIPLHKGDLSLTAVTSAPYMSANPGQAAGHANAARIGRWIVPAIPFGWTWVPDFGIQKRTFLDPTIAGPAPMECPGADEAAMLMLKLQAMHQVSVFQVQHYVRSGNWIGIATLTTLESELLKVRPDFDQFMKLLRVEPVAG